MKPTFTLRGLLLLMLLVGLAITAIGLIPVVRWDGTFALSIHPTSKSGRSIASMSYLPVSSRDFAQYLTTLESLDDAGLDECKFENGFAAYLPTFGTSNIFGVNISRGEWKYAVIVAKYADNSESMAVVEAPAGHGPRNVSVELP